MLNKSGINAISNKMPNEVKNNNICCNKPFCTAKDISDTVTFHKRDLDTPVIRSSVFNYQELPSSFSPEDIEKIRQTGKLPDGYLMAYTPKTVVHNYVDGCYVGDGVYPPSYTLIKDNKISKFLHRRSTLSDEIPNGFKILESSNGKLYIVSDSETKESLDKKTRFGTMFNSLFEKKGGKINGFTK